MKSLTQCVILSVTLSALTGIVAADEPNADQLRQEGRVLQMKAEKLRSEGKIGDADEVAREAEKRFRRADEFARQRGPDADQRGQGDRWQQGPRQPQSGVPAVMEAIGRQMKAVEGYIADLRGRGMGNRAEQLQRDVSQLRENLERIERDLREGQPGGPGPGPHPMSPGPGPTPFGGSGMRPGGPDMPGGFRGQPGGPPGMPGGPQGMPMGPGPESRGPDPRTEHVQQALHQIHEAASNLKAAGFHELAQKLVREADQLKKDAFPFMEKDELCRTVRKLGEEMGRLHNEMNELRRRIDERR